MKSTRFFKTIFILLFTAVLLCALFVLVSCKHTHNYERVVKSESTCSVRGETEYVCKCGDSYVKREGLLPHELETAFDEQFHWQKCRNCGYVADKTAHEYVTAVAGKSKPSTCSEHGYETKACVCGRETQSELPLADHELGGWISENGQHYKKCSNCNYVTEKTAHAFSAVVAEKSRPSTCTESGYETRACVCGEERKFTDLPLAPHSYGAYVIAADRHYRQCARCSAVTEEASHSYTSVVASKSKPSTCLEGGYETKACICGAERKTDLPVAAHSYTVYATAPDGTSDKHWRECATCGLKLDGSDELHVTEGQEVYHEGSCVEHPYTEVICSLCKTHIKYEEEGYGSHSPVYYQEKPSTDYQDGSKAYWKCELCKRMFKGHGCNDYDELFEADIIVPRKIKILASYDELLAAAKGTDFSDPVQSGQMYQITLGKGTYLCDGAYVYWSPKKGAEAEINLIGDVSKLVAEKCDLTVKFNITYDSASETVSLFNGSVVEVSSAADARSLKIKMSGAGYSDYVNVYVNGELSSDLMLYGNNADNEYFWYAAFNANDTVKFTCQAYAGKKLKTLVINGKSYSLTDGETSEITVTEDISAEFTFTDSGYTNTRVTVNKIDTSEWNAPARAVDPYLSYKYVGTNNEYGRLYKGSATKFYVENAYITRVTIEYDSDENYLKEALKNTVNVAVGENSYKNPCSQTPDGTGRKVAFVFLPTDKYRYFEYKADSGQARIASITIEYTTDNTFAV